MVYVESPALATTVVFFKQFEFTWEKFGTTKSFCSVKIVGTTVTTAEGV